MTVSAAKKDRAELATHLIKTPHPEWAGWRCAGLRGAGFPADGVLKLSATPEVLRAVERYLNELLLVEQTRESSLREVNACLDELRARGKWNDKAHRNRFVRARDYLKSANDPQKILEMEECPSMRELKDALKRSREAADAYKTAFQLGAENQSEAIWEVASSPKFREAVLWQNRAAVHNALAPLLRHMTERGLAIRSCANMKSWLRVTCNVTQSKMTPSVFLALWVGASSRKKEPR